jgi:hypothetical protein
MVLVEVVNGGFTVEETCHYLMANLESFDAVILLTIVHTTMKFLLAIFLGEYSTSAFSFLGGNEWLALDGPCDSVYRLTFPS